MNKNNAKTLTHTIAMAVLTTPLSTHVFAEEAINTMTGRESPIIVTAGKREQPIYDVQASVAVISEKDIRTYPGASLTEVLRQSVGIDARSSGANSTISVRGQIPGAGSAVLLLFDGLPRPGKFGNIDLNNFPVEGVERIEVIRGPMSALYGANASGGVINVITKKPGAGKPLSGRILAGSSLSADGDGRETITVAASSDFTTGSVGHRLSLDYRHAEPFRFDDSNDEDDLTGIDHVSLNYAGAVATQAGNGELRWTIEAYRADDRRDGLTRTGTSFERFEEEDRYLGTIAYDLDLAVGSLTFDALYGKADAKVNRSFPGPDETTEYTQQQAQARYYVPLESHNLLLGVGARNDEIDVSILSDVGEQTNIFAFLQDEWDLKEKIKVVAGIRIDDYDDFGTQVVPRLSIGSRGDGFTWRLGYGEAFRAPSVVELFSRFTRGRFLITGSTDLDPEESETIEVAVGWRGERGGVEVVYHDTSLTNLIESEATGAMVDGLIEIAYQNIAEADIRGVEIVGSYHVTTGIKIDAAYEYLDATDASTGDRLEGRTRSVIRASLAWEEGPWGVHLRGRRFGDLYDSDPAIRGGPAFETNYYVIDTQVAYRINDEFGLSIGIENIFDEQVPVNWSGTGAIEDPAGRYGYLALDYVFGN